MSNYWYVKLDGKTESGPISSETLKQLAQQGKVTPDTPLKKGVSTGWVSASHAKGLFPPAASQSTPATAEPSPKSASLASSPTPKPHPVVPPAQPQTGASSPALQPYDILEELCPSAGSSTWRSPGEADPGRSSPASARWYWCENGKTFGPYSDAELKEMALEGTVGPAAQVKEGEHGSLRPVSQVPGIAFPTARAQQAVERVGPMPPPPAVSKPVGQVPLARSIPAQPVRSQQPTQASQSPDLLESIIGEELNGDVASTAKPRLTTTKTCPFCSETILRAAKKCKHCGEYLDATVRGAAKPTKTSSDALGIVIMLLPLASAALMWFWVGSMNLLQNPSSTLMGIVIFTVIVTSALMAVEAGQLGMGGKRDGKATTGPAGWFLFGLVLWLVALPAYLYTRSKFGVKNHVVGGLVSVLFFLGVAFVLSNAIEQHMAEVRRQF